MIDKTKAALIAVVVVLGYMYMSKRVEGFVSDLTPYADHGVCSKRCCSNQFPTSMNEYTDPRIEDKINKTLFPSNLTCRDGVRDVGCVCMTDKSRRILNNRGIDSE